MKKTTKRLRPRHIRKRYEEEADDVFYDCVIKRNETLDEIEYAIWGHLDEIYQMLQKLLNNGISIPKEGHPVNINFMLMDDFLMEEEKSNGLKIPPHMEDSWNSLFPPLPPIPTNSQRICVYSPTGSIPIRNTLEEEEL